MRPESGFQGAGANRGSILTNRRDETSAAGRSRRPGRKGFLLIESGSKACPHAEAGALLGEVYDWFTEGFDTPDLLAARPLLKELRLGHPAA